MGLHDMLGNQWEWCWDLYDPHTYGPYRIFRGGGHADLPRSIGSTVRRRSHPTLKIEDLGLRLAQSIPTPNTPNPNPHQRQPHAHA
ncbi:hypothetical protein GCM10010522_26480 [Kribbella solani]